MDFVLTNIKKWNHDCFSIIKTDFYDSCSFTGIDLYLKIVCIDFALDIYSNFSLPEQIVWRIVSISASFLQSIVE